MSAINHTTARTLRAFTLIEILIVVVILGVLAAIIIPRFTTASQEAKITTVQTTLETLRGEIELYNVQHPASRYDVSTPGDGFWDPLVQGNYLQMMPKNPLQNGSTVVADTPSSGVGWVWAAPGGPWALSIFAVDDSGAFFDSNQDGQPD